MSLNDAVRKFVWSKQPKDATECGQFADLSYEVSRVGNQRGPFPANGYRNQGNGNARPFEQANRDPSAGKGHIGRENNGPRRNNGHKTGNKIQACYIGAYAIHKLTLATGVL